ncbi:hypothetical protein CGRA01v4_11851 [Colletotrichum graminicola]|nr:hypothetical protein CGRA01v4_11851 [Colletotrichum graminicola]
MVIGPRPWSQINPSINLMDGRLVATTHAANQTKDLSISRRLETLSGRNSFGSPSDGFPGGAHYDDDAPEMEVEIQREFMANGRNNTRDAAAQLERAMALLIRSFRTSTTPTKPEPQQGRYEWWGRRRQSTRDNLWRITGRVKQDGRWLAEPDMPTKKKPWSEPRRSDERRRPSTGCPPLP